MHTVLGLSNLTGEGSWGRVHGGGEGRAHLAPNRGKRAWWAAGRWRRSTLAGVRGQLYLGQGSGVRGQGQGRVLLQQTSTRTHVVSGIIGLRTSSGGRKRATRGKGIGLRYNPSTFI